MYIPVNVRVVCCYAFPLLALGMVFGTSTSVAQSIYWIDHNHSIKRYDTLRGSIEHVAPHESSNGLNIKLNHVLGLALDTTNGFLYWTDSFPGKIVRSNLDGSNPAIIYTASEDTSINGIDYDSVTSKIYWTQEPSLETENPGHILRANHDGSNLEIVYSSQSKFDNLSRVLVGPNNSYFYWREFKDGGISIQRSDLINFTVDTVASGFISTMGDFALDFNNQNLWWSITRTDFVTIRADLDGSNENRIFEFFIGLMAFAQREQRLYFIDEGLKRVNTDGTDLQSVVPDGIVTGFFAIDDRLPGDCSNDQTLDLTDFLNMSACFTGPDQQTTNHCICTDTTGNRTTDLADFARFQLAFMRQ